MRNPVFTFVAMGFFALCYGVGVGAIADALLGDSLYGIPVALGGGYAIGHVSYVYTYGN